MRKLGNEAIHSIIKRAFKEFLKDSSAPERVSFLYRDHRVEAKFLWSHAKRTWYVSSFSVVYSRSIMLYFVGNDYDLDSAIFR